MKDLRDLKDLTIHDAQHVSDEYSTLWRGRGDLVEREPRDVPLPPAFSVG